MEKEDNYAATSLNPGLSEMDYSAAGNSHQQMLMMNNPQQDHYGSNSMERSFSSFGDVMQPNPGGLAESSQGMKDDDHYYPDDQSRQDNDGSERVVQLEFLGSSGGLNQMMMLNTANSSDQVMMNHNNNNNNGKTTEEVESQIMTHIAVERNRRKQMNEHLRVLRTLMPSSYVQRGDQASIIGGAIEFCLESQKHRRFYGEATPSGGNGPLPLENNQPYDPNNPPTNANEDNQAMAPNKLVVDLDNTMMMNNLVGLQEETAESKSSIADVEVKLLGFDAFIKILSRRRSGQLIKAISALQDLQFNILHTNVTTIEQTVLYSFNVQISSDTRFSAEDIASSVQQIFTFIHASSTM
ncbi:hypothetical protein V2J09_021525 [Rumex salicifolius]